MPIYKIADLAFRTECKGEYLKNLLQPYIFDSAEYSFNICVNKNDLEYEKKIAPNFSWQMYESSAVLRQLSNKITEYDGILFHGAAIEYNKTAYLFCAPSGTGKTTHIMLWKKLLGDKVTVINGDKPFVRLKDGVPIVYGSPWQGKENLGTNTKCRLGGIVFVNRSAKNYAVPLSPADSVFKLLSSAAYKKTTDGTLQTLRLLEEITKQIRLFDLFCNMEDDASRTALAALTEDSNEN